MKRFKTILFEGTECAGKTTQIKHIAKALADKGYKVAIEKEPDVVMEGIIFDKKLSQNEKYHLLTAHRYLKYFTMKYTGYFDDYDIVLFDRGVLSTMIYQAPEDIGVYDDNYEIKLLENKAFQFYDDIFVDTTNYDEYIKRLNNRVDTENDELDYQTEFKFNNIKYCYESLLKGISNKLNLPESEKLEIILKNLEGAKNE